MNNQFPYVEKYAGFWKRFVAYIIDEIILGLIRSIFIVPLVVIFSFSSFPFWENGIDESFVNASSSLYFGESTEVIGIVIAAFIFFSVLISVITGWLYYAIMESSKRQATFGKVVLSIKVTDLNGNRIQFAKASARYFSKIISTLFFYIGFIIAGFTEKKQALHDLISGCLVVNNSAEILSDIELENDLFKN